MLPYACQDCGEQFSDKDSYYSHLQEYHPIRYHEGPRMIEIKRERQQRKKYHRPRQKLYDDPDFRICREIVSNRDGNICLNCGKEEQEKSFNCHHVVLPVSTTRVPENVTYREEQGGIVMNHPDALIQLCPECDERAENGGSHDLYLLAQAVRSAYRSESDYPGQRWKTRSPD